MNCNHCGAEIEENSNFCVFCGCNVGEFYLQAEPKRSRASLPVIFGVTISIAIALTFMACAIVYAVLSNI